MVFKSTVWVEIMIVGTNLQKETIETKGLKGHEL